MFTFQKAFVDIYNKQLWGEQGQQNLGKPGQIYKASGPGSTLEASQVGKDIENVAHHENMLI